MAEDIQQQNAIQRSWLDLVQTKTAIEYMGLGNLGKLNKDYILVDIRDILMLFWCDDKIMIMCEHLIFRSCMLKYLKVSYLQIISKLLINTQI